MRIKVLPDTVINQIAAGEVVERPASVVRELVDNAIDAGATDVFVALEAGGHTRLKVRDNGCGMSKDEAILAFERHATSKVSSIEDLQQLSTLGFRGEALASIAAVSKMHLKTRARDGGEVGTHVVYRGGRLSNVETIPWNIGTEFEVEHLFFNTPARRKFLKSPRSEVARVRTWLAQSGLARPSVRYRLVSDGDEVLHLQPVATIAERAKSVFPSDLIPIQLSESGVSIEGMVSHPGQALADQSGFVVLVNGRLVSDKLIHRAVREGYDSMLKDREYPVGYIAITLASEEVDVNVHPQKSEVRFRHPQQLFSVVKGAVTAGVRSIRKPIQGVSQVNSEYSSSFVERAVGEAAQQINNFSDLGSKSASVMERANYVQSNFVVPLVERQGAELRGSDWKATESKSAESENIARQSFSFSNLRYIGQALGCYLICDLDEQVVVVDMHAAHERINYNRIRKARAEEKITSQRLLIPETVRLTEEQVVRLIEQEDLLKELGFEISQISNESIAVSGVPGVVAHLNCGALLKECAAEPLADGWRERLEERIDHIAARLACHASVRSGDIINRNEAYALFAQLEDADLAGACPHGRPVVASFSRQQVERWFGRDR